MPEAANVYNVFIASPSDVSAERQILDEVIRGISRACELETQLRVRLLRWEDVPAREGRPQGVINVLVDKADLFIGCLWRTMGTAAGPDGRTGFEEEFYRALDRNQKSGSPRISLFFKKVDETGLRDPDRDLAAVLAFRQKLVDERLLLFDEFETVEEWREQTRVLVTAKVLELIQNDPAHPTRSDSARSGGDGHSTPPTELAPALKHLAKLVKTTGEQIEIAGSTVVLREQAETVRFLLFAATNYDWFSQRNPFGVHEMNSLFLHREKVQISNVEQVYILRTLLLDQFLSKPGWFWLSHWKIKPQEWLTYLATKDTEPVIREKALQVAARARFRFDKPGTKKLIGGILSDQAASVRIAGLDYLDRLGDTSDLPLIEKLFDDPDLTVRDKAIDVNWCITLQANPDSQLRLTIENHLPISPDRLSRIQTLTAKFSSNTVEDAAKYSDRSLREWAARTLVARNAMSLELAQSLLKDESPIVREQSYVTLARQRQSFDMEKMQKDLEQGTGLSLSLYLERGNVTRVVESMLEMSDDEQLWQLIDSFDKNAASALKIIGERSVNEFGERIRTALSDRFETQSAAARTRLPPVPQKPLLSLWPGYQSNQIAERQEELIRTALEAIARKPGSSDRETFLHFLSDPKSGSVFACLAGLQLVGQPADRQSVLRYVSSTSVTLQRCAIRTYLTLSTNQASEAVSAVLNGPAADSPQAVWAVVEFAVEKHIKIWAALEPMLCSENADIRRFIAFYASEMLTRQQLLKCLNSHMSQPTYYYNVVTLLDRRLFGPKLLKPLWRTEETEHQAALMSAWAKPSYPFLRA